jgi:hypothetical protein
MDAKVVGFAAIVSTRIEISLLLSVSANLQILRAWLFVVPPP